MPAPGVTLDRRNLCVIETQVQPAYQFPKGTRTVVLVDQLLNIDGAQQDLPAINGNQSRTWRRRMVAHTCSVRTFVDSAIVLWRPSVDFFTASRREVHQFPSVGKLGSVPSVPGFLVQSSHAHLQSSPTSGSPLLWALIRRLSSWTSAHVSGRSYREWRICFVPDLNSSKILLWTKMPSGSINSPYRQSLAERS